MFLGIFGSTRIDRAAYDRGLMCEFYSPTGIVRRQLVTRHNVMIKPRLNIIAAGHPKRTIDCLTGKIEKMNTLNILSKCCYDIICIFIVLFSTYFSLCLFFCTI